MLESRKVLHLRGRFHDEAKKMSDYRLTVNTQQLVDVLIIAIAEKAENDELITVEEIHKILVHFDELITDLIDHDEVDHSEVNNDSPEDLDE